GQVATGGHSSLARAAEMARSRRRYWRHHYTRGGRLLAQACVSLEFLTLAVISVLRGRSGKAFWVQARESVRESSRPGLREQAARGSRASLRPSPQRERSR